jgi:hypothetical protein
MTDEKKPIEKIHKSIDDVAVLENAAVRELNTTFKEYINAVPEESAFAHEQEIGDTKYFLRVMGETDSVSLTFFIGQAQFFKTYVDENGKPDPAMSHNLISDEKYRQNIAPYIQIMKETSSKIAIITEDRVKMYDQIVNSIKS